MGLDLGEVWVGYLWWFFFFPQTTENGLLPSNIEECFATTVFTSNFVFLLILSN